MTIKRNEVLTHATTCMNFENIMLSERRSYKRPHIAGLHLYVQNRQLYRDKSRLVVARGWGDWRMTSEGCRISTWDDGNFLKFTVVIV